LQADALTLQHTAFNTPEEVARHNRILSPQFARAHGFELISPSIPEDNYYRSEIGPEEVRVLVEQLHRARRLARGRLKLFFFPKVPFDLIEQYYLDIRYPFSHTCDSLSWVCRILPDGNVMACFNILCGNVREQSLMDIWQGEPLSRFREIVSRRLFPGCARCCRRRYA